MTFALNLEKSVKSLTLSLEKVGIVSPPNVDVGFCLDVSGSFEDEHRDGSTNTLLTRLIPWGLVFDPDKKIEVFTFSDGEDNVCEVGSVDANNHVDFVQRKIVGKVRGWNGGTDYSYALERMLKHFGWINTVKKPGFFGKMFGKTDEVIFGEKKKSIVIFTTDGENLDQTRTTKILRESKERGDKVYFLFLGISNQGSSFSFLKSLDRQFENTGFINIKNLNDFNALTDEAINEMILSEELLAWVKS